MKIAIVHDYIKEYGGAERVLEALHEIFPEAPVYTAIYIPKFLGPHQNRFKNWNIQTSWLQKIPFKHKMISPFRLIAPWIFRGFDLSDFDIVIVSATGAYAPNFVRSKVKSQNQKTKNSSAGAIHICYCHTPPRYLYGYKTARDWKSNKILYSLGSVINHFLRIADYYASKNVDFYIANSDEVSSRIKKFYRRDSKVIYPPVEISSKYHVSGSMSEKEKISKGILNTKYLIQNTKYYLTGGRLARAKNVDLIVKACEELGAELKVFGRGFAGYEDELKTRSSKVEFLGEVSDDEKLNLMQNAKAFIFAGEDEDFGIVPVEAMSMGLPIIAYKSGGVKETIIEGKTGLFFNELTVESLREVIQKFEKTKINPDYCRKQAIKFSKEIFNKEVKSFVYDKFKK